MNEITSLFTDPYFLTIAGGGFITSGVSLIKGKTGLVVSPLILAGVMAAAIALLTADTLSVTEILGDGSAFFASAVAIYEVLKTSLKKKGSGKESSLRKEKET